MQLDRDSLNKLLSLNDRQLSAVIGRLASENGIDLSAFSIDPKDIQALRSALQSATDADLERVRQQYEDYRRHGGR